MQREARRAHNENVAAKRAGKATRRMERETRRVSYQQDRLPTDRCNYSARDSDASRYEER